MDGSRMRSDGSLELVDVDGSSVWWRRREEWATDWIDEARHDESGPAHTLLQQLIDTPAAGMTELLALLAVRADGDDDLTGYIGAGSLEDLVSHSGNGLAMLDETERAVSTEPALRRAMASVWLGHEVPPLVIDRLTPYGAQDIR